MSWMCLPQVYCVFPGCHILDERGSKSQFMWDLYFPVPSLVQVGDLENSRVAFPEPSQCHSDSFQHLPSVTVSFQL